MEEFESKRSGKNLLVYEQKRQALLTAALEVFTNKGFGHASMDDVVEVAGVSKRTAYRHFPGKKELFLETVIFACDKSILEPLLIEVDAGSDPKSVLTQFGLDFLNLLTRPEIVALYRIVIAEAPRFPELGKFYYGFAPKAFVSCLQQYFEKQIQEGVFKINDAAVAADLFQGLVRGGVHLREMLCVPQKNKKEQIEASVGLAVDIFLNGVLVAGD